jgi:hypothetical protein
MKDPASILFNDTHGGAKQEECEWIEGRDTISEFQMWFRKRGNITDNISYQDIYL